MKKWGRRILLGLLISLTVSIVAPSFMGDYVDTSDQTAYSATTAPPCRYDGNDKEPKCTIGKDNKLCPGGYAKDPKEPKICIPQTTKAKTDESVLNTMKFLIGMQNLLNRALWPVLVMIGGLMDNSLLFGNGMEERLREIWIPIRNIVNILFVVALVAIALYNVLGIGDENSNYSIKAILPKIIIGIIVVNFSFFGIKVFLDGINVLTTAIFALPNQVGTGLVLDPKNPEDQDLIDKYCRSMKGKDFNEILDPVVIKKETEDETYRRIAKTYGKIFEGLDASATKADILKIVDAAVKAKEWEKSKKDKFTKTVDENINNTICTTSKKDKEGKTKYVLTSRGEFFLKRWNSRNASLAMALSLSKIVFYKEIDLNSLKSLDKLVINAAMSLIMYLLFASSFIALFVVLLGRLVVMWLAIALSPILLLVMVIPAVKESAGGFGEIQTQFVQNAIAPLGIGLSLSVGWIMLKALQGLNSLYGGEQISFTATGGIPVVGLTTLQDLLVGVGTIAVIWLGVFAAASKTVAAPLTDKMKGMLSSAGSWVGTLPLKHAPIFRIDLPNSIDGGDDKYTGTQILDALTSMTHAKDPGKLTRLLGHNKARSADILNHDKIKTKDNVVGFLKDAKQQKMSASELKTSMRSLIRDRKPLWQDIQKNHTNLAGRIKAMAGATTKNMEDKRKDLLEHGDVRAYVKPKAGEKASSKATITENTIVTGNIKIGTKSAATVKANLGQIQDELALTEPNKAKITKLLGIITASLPNSKTADIRSKVLKGMEEDLKTLYGSDAAVNTAIGGKPTG